MLQRVRGRLTFANVTSLVALFVALSGGVYAAAKIDGSDIKRKSIPGNRLVPNTVTGRQVNENKLRFTCPAETRKHAGACIETGTRPAQDVFDASTTCAADGRRLPTASELVALAERTDLMSDLAFEVSSNIYSPEPNGFGYIGVRGTAVVDDLTSTDTSLFRCVAPPVKIR